MADTTPQTAPTEVKELIVHEALRLFGTQGYEATSLQAIADGVGIRKQSLLYHFASKAELHRRVIDDALDYWRRELPRVIGESASGYGRFESAVSATLRFFQEDPDRARLAMREMLDRPADLMSGMREHLGPWIRMLTEYIRLGQASGTVKPGVDPEAYLVQVLTLLIGSAVVGPVMAGVFGDDGRPDLQQQTEELVRIARDALFSSNPSNPRKA